MAVEVVRVALWQKLAVCSIGCETSRHRPTGRPASLVMPCPERSDLLPFLGIALITATMFSAVNIPTPRVVFGMVVSGTDGVGVLRVGGAV